MSEMENEKKDGADAAPPQENRNGKRASDSKNIPLPHVTFSTLIMSLASSALVQLGEVPNPETGKNEENLDLAKHSIDILDMLDQKIKNGLDQEENRLLEGILYELRMKYVIKVK